MDCATWIAIISRYFLIIFNCIIFVFALILVISSAIASGNCEPGLENIPGCQNNVYGFLIGIITCSIAFLGCWGAKNRNSCMLFTYIGILTGSMILHSIVGLLSLHHHSDKNRDEVYREVRYNLLKIFDQYPDRNATKKIDEIQRNYECCGVDGPFDWNATDFPSSCCRSSKIKCTPIVSYQAGCADVLTEIVIKYSATIGWTALITVLVEFLCVICACFVVF